jgi:glycosyltransferase involved in cell wall biosynthesis
MQMGVSSVLVSVVIPCYNAEEWIAETIASVVKQTHQALEIIVVDDGSTDRTAEIASRSLEQSPFPHRILQQANSGAAAARNQGWRASNGTWLQFLDADDLIEPQKIEIQVVRCAENVDVVYSDWQKLGFLGDAWTAYDLRTPVIRADGLADVLSDRNFLQLGCALFRKEIVAAVGGFDAEHEPIEDVGLCVKIVIARGTFAKAESNGPVAYYRDLPRSFSKINHRRFIESCIKNARLAEQHVTSHPTRNPKAIDAIVEVYFTGARFYAGLDWNRFDELLADIYRLQPNFVPRRPRALSVLSRVAGYRRAERVALLRRKLKSIGANMWRREKLCQ